VLYSIVNRAKTVKKTTATYPVDIKIRTPLLSTGTSYFEKLSTFAIHPEQGFTHRL
jgi:hypothetical protein